MTETSARFGRERTLDGGWQDLGTRHERFESQPPTDDKGDHAKLSFKQRRAFRLVQSSIETLSDAHTITGSGRRTRTTLPTLAQRRHDKRWRQQVTAILAKHQAAEASAQVIHLTPHHGQRRAA